MSERFTVDGGEDLESYLADLCRRVADDVRKGIPSHRLEAILLGGGYGRGEGGVYRSESGEIPYNDMEFYIFMSGSVLRNEAVYGARIENIGRRLSREHGIEIELKIVSTRKLKRSPPSMFYYDLTRGHKLVCGELSLLRECPQHAYGGNIPWHEGSRLLMNRCTGLLFSLERQKKADVWTHNDLSFIRRNHAKLELALGDAVLVANGQYHWSCRERQRRLQSIPAENGPERLREVTKRHRNGVSFKLYPTLEGVTLEGLKQEQRELSRLARKVWLWYEDRRKASGGDANRGDTCGIERRMSRYDRCLNRLIHFKAFGAGAFLQRRSYCYPRERLLRALPLLLWEPGGIEESGGLARIQEELMTTARHWEGLVEAFKGIWTRYR